jgi:hypothetical protein
MYQNLDEDSKKFFDSLVIEENDPLFVKGGTVCTNFEKNESQNFFFTFFQVQNTESEELILPYKVHAVN